MRVFAYCAKSFEKSAWRMAGVRPMTCPPFSAETFDPIVLAGHALLFFDLHGMPGEPRWRGDDHVVALTADQIRSVDLGGSIVFALNCYLANDDSPMMDALLDAGARYVIGGDGKNWAGGTWRIYGATELGLWFRRFFTIGIRPERALALAKMPVKRDLKRQERKGKQGHANAAKDTLEFKLYHRERPSAKQEN